MGSVRPQEAPGAPANTCSTNLPTCKRCQRQRPHKARGLCHSCYVMAVRNKEKLPRKKGHSHLRVLGRRTRKRRVDALLNRQQVRAAYELYKAGLEISDIAERGWHKWGYSSPARASKQIYLAFTREGFRQRNGKLFGTGDRCAGCGCAAEDRTFACRTCRTRHQARKRRGLPFRDAKAALPAEARKAA